MDTKYRHLQLLQAPTGGWTLMVSDLSTTGTVTKRPSHPVFDVGSHLCLVLDWLATPEGGGWELVTAYVNKTDGLLRAVLRCPVNVDPAEKLEIIRSIKLKTWNGEHVDFPTRTNSDPPKAAGYRSGKDGPVTYYAARTRSSVDVGQQRNGNNILLETWMLPDGVETSNFDEVNNRSRFVGGAPSAEAPVDSLFHMWRWNDSTTGRQRTFLSAI